MPFCRGLLIFATLILGPAAAFAQNNSTRADIARSQTDVIATDHAPPSPNDADLGEQAILTRSESYQPFQASFGLPAYYTSNVALSRSHEQDDFLAAPVVVLSFQPRLTPTLYAFAMVREQLFYYDRFDQLNFGSFDVRAGLSTVLPKAHNLILRAEYAHNRLTVSHSFNDFFSKHSILLSADVPFPFERLAVRASGRTDRPLMLSAPSARLEVRTASVSRWLLAEVDFGDVP